MLNTGVSTLSALGPAAAALTADGVLLRYTDLLRVKGPVVKEISEQEGGTHADEIETSVMLYIAPGSVDLTKAVKDFHPDRPGGLTRDPGGCGTYSPTGTWGDPTLATREKGRRVTEALVQGILREIEDLRGAALPVAPGAPGA